MVGIKSLIITLVTGLLLGQSLAHPGHSDDHEIAERRAYLKHAKKDLSHCRAKLAGRGVEARSLDRRTEKVYALREKVKNKKAKRCLEHSTFATSTSSAKSASKASGHGKAAQGGSGHATTSHESSSRPSSSHRSSSRRSSSHRSSSDRSSSHGSSSHGASAYDTSSSATSAFATSAHATSSSTASASAASSSTTSSSAISSSAAFSSTASSSAASSSTDGPSGAAASGAMPSGGQPGNNSTNSTGDAGQGASSISTFGAEVANTSHLSNDSVTPTTSGVETIIFSNHSCILNPEGEVGPFYVSGELIRTDIAETQEGVPIHIDGQFIDVTTCEPIENLYWDVWHANSTGVYAGVIAQGNGNAADTTNLNNTFLRGLQPTDSDGVAQFDSIFPGHYSGRATHIHVVAHIGGSVLSNGTYVGGTIAHTGQFLFDQDLITEINDNIAPYSTNTIAIVENVDDRVFITETESDSDPVFDYVLLGDDVADGLFMWVDIGIDTSATYTAAAAAAYGEDGGVLE